MEIQQRQLVNKYLDLFSRRKIFIFIVFLLSLPIGLGVYLRIPKVYESSVLLSYQAKISPNSMSPDVHSGISDIVSTLSQIVTSRTNLEKIILEHNLFSEQREILPIEDVIDIFRKKIVIQPSDRGDVFTILYSGTNPEQVVKVTNAIAAKFIEENLKYRQQRAMETSSYTNQELQMAKKVMDEKENAMRDYKLKNYNEMPEHREANMSQLTALQAQYQGKQESIQDLERTVVLIRDQLNNRRMLVRHPTGSGAESHGLDNVQQLEKLRSTLDTLLLKYTEKHPEIIRIRKLIEKLQLEIKGGGGTKNSSKTIHRSASTGGLKDQHTAQQSGSYDQIMMQLEAQLKDVKLNIANVEHEKIQLKEKIEQYEKWISNSPIREAEWSSLTREYDQLKKHYDYLVSQNLQAESMLNLEERLKGSQFKIEDPGRYPGKPVKPNFLIIIGMSVMAGLGVGLGSVVALDIFDASFRDPETLEPLLGVPLLITIPHVETNVEQKKQKWLLLLTVSLLLLGSVLVISLFVHVWIRGDIVF